MITLTIRRQDGSIYWVEHFNSMAEGQAWLNREQTRPYWQADFTTSFQDNTPPPPTQAALAKWVRIQRNALLTQSDWTQIPDSNLDVTTKKAWSDYRKALRDLPNQPGFDPANVTWPTPPDV